jgi:hypothetical protein
MNKLFDLAYIIILALSYVIVYDIAKARSDNDNKTNIEIMSMQMDMMLKERHIYRAGVKR